MELEEAIKRFNEIKEEYNKFDGLKEYVEAMDFISNHLTKQEKIIDFIIAELANYDNDYICHSIECKDIGCKECLKQYFKKKSKESE